MIWYLFLSALLQLECDPCPTARQPTEATLARGRLEFPVLTVKGSHARFALLEPDGKYYDEYQAALAIDPSDLTKRPTLLRFVAAPVADERVSADPNSNVTVEALLDPTGTVRAVRVLESSDCTQVTTSVTAVLRSTFSAAEIDGTPVWSVVRLPFSYQLGD